MLRVVTVAVLVLVLVMEAHAGCRHWCKKPGGPPGSVYCCDTGTGEGQFEVHPGRCPKRPICPPGLRYGENPRVCAHDGQCPYHEKCCPDACLEHHTCLIPDRY